MKSKTKKILLGLSLFTLAMLGIGRLLDSRCEGSCIVEAARANAGADWSKLNGGPFNFNYRYSSSDDSFRGTHLAIDLDGDEDDTEENALRKSEPLREDYEGQSVKDIQINSYVTQWSIKEGSTDKLSVTYRGYLEGKEWTVNASGDRLNIKLGKKGPLEAELTLPKDYRGDLHLETVSGDCDLSSLAQTRALTVTGVSSDLQVKSAPSEELRIETVSGDIRFSAQTPRPGLKIALNTISGDASLVLESPIKELKSKTVSGDLELKVSPALGFDFEMETVNGSSEGLATEANAGSPQNHRASLGPEPRARLTFESISGDFKLLQK